MTQLAYAILRGMEGSIPASGDSSKAGRLYFCTDILKIFRDNGTTWDNVTPQSATWGSITGTLTDQSDLATALGTKEVTTNKGAANGYAPLGSDSKVPSANLPTIGAGDMLKSTYDTNNDGVVDAAAAVPWTGVSSKPTTFAPDNHGNEAHSATFITAADVHAAMTVADTASVDLTLSGQQISAAVLPGGIKLDAFAAPDDSASTTGDATIGHHGLCPKLPNDATKYLRGDGQYAVPTAGEVGGIPVTTIDAKGDLLVGTAPDTVGRLAIGANGTSPVADDTQPTGIRWAASGGGADPVLAAMGLLGWA